MTEERFEMLCNECLLAVRNVAPIKTGNLRFNATMRRMTDGKTCVIYVDEDIAPYMPFTTEPWMSPKWNGKKNPNEGWWQEKAKAAITESIRQFLARQIVKETEL